MIKKNVTQDSSSETDEESSDKFNARNIVSQTE